MELEEDLSAFAEMMVVHEHACTAIDPEMPLDRASVIGCAVTTGAGAIFNACKLTPGETVAVVGCGGVGLNVMLWSYGDRLLLGILAFADALFLVTRSETPKAVALTREMIAVYMAARRGLLPRPAPAALPPEIVAEVATLRAEVADLRGELATGVIGPDVAAREIVAPLRRIAHLRGSTPKQRKSWRSRVERLLRNRLGHSRRGATWARLDRKLLTVAQNSIGEWLDDAIAYARKNPPGQMTLPGTGRRPSTERPS
mgnify:CR=1 FL=1